MIEIDIHREAERFGAFLSRLGRRAHDADPRLVATVAAIIDEVRKRGDAALIDYTREFDGIELSTDAIRTDTEELKRTASGVSSKLLDAIRESIRRVRLFHERQVESSWELSTADGVRLGQRITPVERAGLYVPGGTASYPSSVIMNAVPAQVAGVREIVVVTPPRALAENPAVAATLVELGLTEVYSIGGAQAIAALAYGTQTIPRVDKITGPGNRYVATAKRLIFGAAGIDSIAGPSEVVIIADAHANPAFIAADLLAQAEHAEDASAILVCTDRSVAAGVRSEVERQLELLPRRSTAARSIDDYGAILLVETVDDACDVANRLAPEHLEIMTEHPDDLIDLIKHAGAIFLGSYTPEAVGDYLAGPNHVLPTGGSVRFASALGVYDFVKRTSIIKFSKAELLQTADWVVTLAESEGLDAHARSVLIRSQNKEASRLTSASEGGSNV